MKGDETKIRETSPVISTRLTAIVERKAMDVGANSGLRFAFRVPAAWPSGNTGDSHKERRAQRADGKFCALIQRLHVPGDTGWAAFGVSRASHSPRLNGFRDLSSEERRCCTAHRVVAIDSRFRIRPGRAVAVRPPLSLFLLLRLFSPSRDRRNARRVRRLRSLCPGPTDSENILGIVRN